MRVVGEEPVQNVVESQHLGPILPTIPKKFKGVLHLQRGIFPHPAYLHLVRLGLPDGEYVIMGSAH
jgi:hypothetical protein